MTDSPVYRPLAAGLFVTLAVICVSCSKSETLHAVRGQVKYKGEPAKGAKVTFFREGATNQDFPLAVAEADGSFTLMTGGKPGAPAGNYTVTVVWPEIKEPKKGSKQINMGGFESDDAPDRLNGAYASPQKSPLKVEIKSGANELAPFDLK